MCVIFKAYIVVFTFVILWTIFIENSDELKLIYVSCLLNSFNLYDLLTQIYNTFNVIDKKKTLMNAKLKTVTYFNCKLDSIFERTLYFTGSHIEYSTIMKSIRINMYCV